LLASNSVTAATSASVTIALGLASTAVSSEIAKHEPCMGLLKVTR
jgi:hypothetical protein